MDDIEPASPFRRDGITQVPLTRRPLRPTAGRQHFPIRDLRTQPAADSSALERDMAWLDELYRRDLPLREHSLFSVDDVLVLKGSVWHRGTPIAGTLPPKPAKKGDLVGRIAQKIERAGARARLYPGTTAIIHEAGYRNYYHWTVEIMPRLFSLRDAMREGRVTIDRIVLFDEETRRYFVFLTNHVHLPAIVVAQLYKARWTVEIFFKWIKQHLRIQRFFGESANAVKTQVWIAVCVYVLVAIIRKQLKIGASMFTILQILSVSAFDKTRCRNCLLTLTGKL